MSRLSEKFSVNFTTGVFGLSAYTFWAASENMLNAFVFRTFDTMTEHWFLAFAVLGALLLHLLKSFTVFLIISVAYILFLAWPDIAVEQMLGRISNDLGEITVGSTLQSPDAFRVYAMLVAITFCDVLNVAHVWTKEGETT